MGNIMTITAMTIMPLTQGEPSSFDNSLIPRERRAAHLSEHLKCYVAGFKGPKGRYGPVWVMKNRRMGRTREAKWKPNKDWGEGCQQWSVTVKRELCKPLHWKWLTVLGQCCQTPDSSNRLLHRDTHGKRIRNLNVNKVTDHSWELAFLSWNMIHSSERGLCVLPTPGPF